MLIEINLLQKKEPKKPSFLFFIVILILFVASIGITFYYQYVHLQKEVVQIQNQVVTLEAERIELEKKRKTVSTSNEESIRQLESFVESAKSYQLNTIDLLNRLTAHLPPSSVFVEFHLAENIVTVSIQIEKEVDAGFYYRHLYDEPWTDDVKLLQVEAIRTDETDNHNTLSEYIATFEVTINKSALQQLKKEESE
ncbi:hypothetical protein [Bacillus sp. FJAT-47783]|uniref:hypothetical protein n=1 Tax=Bacillus sp. FJAT-47783 TaxID=2922712 RepID=UPI001FACE653|nr:hypothetical protein [Bacillus sp. FJAT-47783]